MRRGSLHAIPTAGSTSCRDAALRQAQPAFRGRRPRLRPGDERRLRPDEAADARGPGRKEAASLVLPRLRFRRQHGAADVPQLLARLLVLTSQRLSRLVLEGREGAAGDLVAPPDDP